MRPIVRRFEPPVPVGKKAMHRFAALIIASAVAITPVADKLEKCKVAPLKIGRLRNFVPVEHAERLSLYGEAVPPGLILGED